MRYVKGNSAMTRSKNEGQSSTLADQRKPSIASFDTITTDPTMEGYRKGLGHTKSRELLKRLFDFI
jgi:hypothetical protein